MLETAAQSAAPQAAPNPPLRIEVVNADLKFVDEPVICGHYRGSVLAGAECLLDWLVGRAMSTSIRLGRYPQGLKAQQVFVNAAGDRINPLRSMPRPAGVIVVGLGDEGHLRASGLVNAVRLGVIAWAQHLAEEARNQQGGAGEPCVPAWFDLAATLVGSGGTGMSPGLAARSVAEGVLEASRMLAAVNWPKVSKLTLVELYLDRAVEGWRAVQLLSDSARGCYDVQHYVRSGAGGQLRPLESSYRGADFDLISAATQIDQDGAASIVYTLDTRRARTEVRAVAAQGRLLQELVSVASSSTCNDASVGRTLFKLLVPVEMRPLLDGSSEMQIELDSGTAGIPWELLDTTRDLESAENTGSADHKPWAIRTKLLRKLRTPEFRRDVEDTGREAPILLIGDPSADDRRYPLLPGARREVRAVHSLLDARLAGARRVTALVAATDTARGPDAREVVVSLLDSDWGVVHIAGHGLPVSDRLVGADAFARCPPAYGTAYGAPYGASAAASMNGAGTAANGAAANGNGAAAGRAPDVAAAAPGAAARAGGVVLSNGVFLGAEEFAKMQRVPELVFINCCYLGQSEPGSLLEVAMPPMNRPYFAASVAEALIRIGVRCVVAAGWAVDDAAAETFATSFYDALLDRRRFLDAVAIAREAAYSPDNNTWAAYQCYGDPDWYLRAPLQDHERPTADGVRGRAFDDKAIADRYACIASSHGLMIALRQIQTELRVNNADVAAARRRLDYLHAQYAQPAPHWERIGEVAEAFADAWKETGDLEQAAKWYQMAVQANDGSATLNATEQLVHTQVRLALQRVREAASGDPQRLEAAIVAAREVFRVMTASLSHLVTLYPSMDRLALFGSASMRLAMVERYARCRDAQLAAIGQTVSHFCQAEAMGCDAGNAKVYYIRIARCSTELVAHLAGQLHAYREPDWKAIGAALHADDESEPDFWSRSARSMVWIYECIASGELAQNVQSVIVDLAELHRCLPARNNWSVLYDQCDFVLAEYAEAAKGPERDAARLLLTQVETWMASEAAPGP
ncbi:CHAT domain-containing protein [Paraburkholderia pallida]|uniref:CHAT domain-containing protein n=1 Tax=Paraburkholderia pallida TaxID=2547399 RepID=A0A4P7CYT0_9BURK|nr:CHAT domain-containing protein [Paraburkholderia pallida]